MAAAKLAVTGSTYATEFKTIAIWNKTIEEGLASGKLPIAPFLILRYNGFTSNPKGYCYERVISIGAIIGVSGLLSEQEAFHTQRTTGVPPAPIVIVEEGVSYKMEVLENIFWNVKLSTLDADLINISPCILGDEVYLGRLNNVECWGMELTVRAMFSKGS